MTRARCAAVTTTLAVLSCLILPGLVAPAEAAGAPTTHTRARSRGSRVR